MVPEIGRCTVWLGAMMVVGCVTSSQAVGYFEEPTPYQ